MPIQRCIGLVAAVSLFGVVVTGARADNSKPKPRPLNVIEGRVVDPTGAPVESAKVVVAIAERGYIFYSGSIEQISTYGSDERVLFFFRKRNGRSTAEATTDADGRFKFSGLIRDRFHLLAAHEKKGLALLESQAFPKKGERLEVALKPGAMVEGRIQGIDTDRRHYYGTIALAEDEEVNTAQGVYINPYLKLDDDGRFRVGPLPASKKAWKLTFQRYVEKRTFWAPVLEVPLRLESGKTESIDIDVSKGPALTGEVRGPDDKPLSDVSVVVRAKAGRAIAYGAVTDGEGRYTIRGMPPGAYTLEAKRWAVRTGPG